MPTDRPGLADWLDLLALLRLDEGQPDAELRRRDREIGVEVGADIPPDRLLAAWVRAVRATDVAAYDATTVVGVKTADAVRWAGGLLTLGGFVLGVSAALGAFAYQPEGRINVVAVIGVLVALPGLFLLLSIPSALPRRLRRWLPIVGSEPEGGGVLQPARWVLRTLPQSAREQLDAAWGRGLAFERIAAPVQRWTILRSSQSAAVAFQLGALAAALALVVFSDLAFGWSTTLDVDAADAHRVTSALAAPWAWAWPDAVPSVELLERTRFFRIAGGDDATADPSLFGEWWRFVWITIAVYGLLPRIVYLGFARRQARAALSRAMVETPGASRVLDRMRSPLVETRPLEHEAGVEAASPGDDAALPGGALPARAVWVSWSEALDQASPSAPEGVVADAFAAGGRRTLAEDDAAAREASARAKAEGQPLALAVRGFEPPVLEVIDFIGALRRGLGDGVEIVVALVGGEAAHVNAWRRKLAAAGDPWLRCVEAVWPAAQGAREEGGT